MGFVAVVCVIFLYFLPTIIASIRGHHNKVPIFLVNLFVGWTGIGFLAALVWSFTSPPPSN